MAVRMCSVAGDNACDTEKCTDFSWIGVSARHPFISHVFGPETSVDCNFEHLL